MKNSLHILPLILFFSFLNPAIFSAQSDADNSLKIFGKVLGDEKSDINVYKNIGTDWQLIRSLKSRGKYSLELNNDYDHYIVFERRDGLIKFLYIDQNKIGKWKMNFDITFDDFSTKNIHIAKDSNSGRYIAVVNKKNYQKIKVNKGQIDQTAITLR